MSADEINQFSKIFSDVDITTFDLLDQLLCLTAYTEFVEKVKPIYLKYAAKDPEITNFIFKL